MEIKTKFNPGDIIWCIYENKAIRSKITGVGISVYETVSTIEYTIDKDERINEDKVFSTKEELLKSL